MSLELLNSKAVQESKYIPFDELPVGIHKINKFDVYNDSKFGSGKRLAIYLEEGYLILPTRMSGELTSPFNIRKLNSKQYDFIYEGKADNQRLNFSFALSKPDEALFDDNTVGATNSVEAVQNQDLESSAPKKKKTK